MGCSASNAPLVSSNGIDVGVGEGEVLVGGKGVFVGTGVSVGGKGVLVGSGVSVGSGEVAVGGTGVGVAVGSSGAGVDGTGVGDDDSRLGVAAGASDAGVAAGAPHPTKSNITNIIPPICHRHFRLFIFHSFHHGNQPPNGKRNPPRGCGASPFARSLTSKRAGPPITRAPARSG